MCNCIDRRDQKTTALFIISDIRSMVGRLDSRVDEKSSQDRELHAEGPSLPL